MLLQHRVIPQHAVEAATQRAGMGVGFTRAADPELEEATRDSIAHLDPRYAGADLDDLPGAVRQRNEARLYRHPVGAQGNRQVAVVERAGRDLEQALAR